MKLMKQYNSISRNDYTLRTGSKSLFCRIHFYKHVGQVLNYEFSGGIDVPSTITYKRQFYYGFNSPLVVHPIQLIDMERRFESGLFSQTF